MPDISDADIVAYTKRAGLYGAIVQSLTDNPVRKDATAGDVHVSTTLGPKKVPATVEDDEVAKRLEESRQRANGEARIIKSWDVDFAKAEAGLYVSRPLMPESAKRLYDWAVEQGIQNVVPADKMHVTQLHSEKLPEGFQPDEFSMELLTVDMDGRFVSPIGDKGAMCLFIRSPQLSQRFKQGLALGADWSFPYFRPHVTLTYDGGNVDIFDWSMLDAPNFPILLGPEKFESNNKEWVEENGLRKSADDFVTEVQIAKVDAPQGIVMGWASVSSVGGVEVIDKQGDIVPVEELEKAAYDFVLTSRAQGDMHETIGVGKLIESMVYTPEKKAAGIRPPLDGAGREIMGWWVGFKVEDPGTLQKIRAGERPEFSIGGSARATQE